jgi:integrase/recombinase XerD
MTLFSYKERQMTALRQRMIEDMQLRNFSPHTIEAYVRAVAQFAKHFGQSPEQLSGEQVRQHLLWLVQGTARELESVQPVAMRPAVFLPRDSGAR